MTGARTIGDIALLEPGCSVWSTERTWAGGEYRFPLGGTIIDVLDKADPETGELVRSFRVLERQRGRAVTHVLAETELNRDDIKLPNPGSMRTLIRGMALELHQSTGPMTQREVDLLTWMQKLMRLVTG